jgi:hypothetical protein
MRGLFFLLLCFPFLSFSQLALNIQILDSETKDPIEFVNVGLLSKGIGTVSNEKGFFSIVIPDSLKTKDFKLSCIGYESKTMPAITLAGLKTVTLKSSMVNLDEVKVVVKRKPKYKVLGNDTKSKSLIAGFNSNTLGSELAIRLNVKHPYTKLKNVKFNIVSNPFDSVVFRFNVYDVKDGRPNQNILKEMILIEPSQKTGLVELDLNKYNIYTDDDVYIAIEWVKDLGDNKGLFFSSQLLSGSSFFRKASQDTWEKVPTIGIGLSSLVEY